MDDYYKILGVSRNASPDKIRQSYLTLLKKYHPDVCQDFYAIDLLQKINEAYDILSDPQKKYYYDNHLNNPSGYPFPQQRQQTNSYSYQYPPKKSTWSWLKKLLFAIVLIFVVLIISAFIMGILSGLSSSMNDTTITTPEANMPIYPRPSTGTVIFTSQYMNGNGFLTVDNSQGYSDAVATLTFVNTKTPIYAFYIEKGTVYQIKEIPDGTYNLYFTTGENWDPNKKKFLINPYYEKFEDTLDFVTTATHYSGWKVTLYGTYTGNADTGYVNEKDFPNL